jgi:hypothetical protein
LYHTDEPDVENKQEGRAALSAGSGHVQSSELDLWFATSRQQRWSRKKGVPMRNREQFPTILEKCKLDAAMEATILDSGRVLLASAQHGVEVVLKPEQAYALLELLYRHHDLFHPFTQKGDQH